MSLGQIRSWVFTIPAATLVTAVLISIAVVTSLFSPSGPWQQFLYRTWGGAVLFVVGGRWKAKGKENLHSKGQYVFASNHMSLMDTPLLFRTLPLDFKFIAKRELLRVPFIGWYLHRAGHLTISRGSIRSSMESMNEAAELIQKRHLSVLVFPEGTRSLKGVQSFKDGAAYLAIQSGVPLVPVAIVGTNRLLAAKSSQFEPADIELRIGKPIPVDGLTLKDRRELTERVQAEVTALFYQKEEFVSTRADAAMAQ